MTVQVKSLDEALQLFPTNKNSFRIKFHGSASFKIQKLTTLTGNEKIQLLEIGNGSIIKLFNRTKTPKNPSDVVCPHFLELKWANGCNFDCAWCYLNGTFRFHDRGKKPYLKKENDIKKHIMTFIQHWDEASVLNSGELADSLVFEGTRFSLTNQIIPLFKHQDKHKLLLLTKSTNINGLLESHSQKNVIVSFSFNAYPVSERWEHKTPHPRDRIKAAKKVFDAGYEVRIRIDPMVQIDGWEKLYRQLIDDTFTSFYPERVTLGTLRGLQSTINNCIDKSWVNYLTSGGKSSWGKKIEDNTRYKMYKNIITYLEHEYNYHNIGICKETLSMLQKLNIDIMNMKCNCTL